VADSIATPKVYAAERETGLGEAIAGARSCTLIARLKTAPPSPDIQPLLDSLMDRIAAGGYEELLEQTQADLAPIVSILVSTGWNLNDDVFLPDETYAAKDTPVHKPINVEHERDRIIGHIIESRAVDKGSNTVVVADGDAPPDLFDVEVGGVLYRSLGELSETIAAIIEDAEHGRGYVSMEAWFTGFDYGLRDRATGVTHVVKRNETTSFLTKHLRVFEGTGRFQGYDVGRVLRNITFAGKAIVANPANPESVIKVAARQMEMGSGQTYVAADLSELLEGEEGMNELDEIKAKLAEATKEIASKSEEVTKLTGERDAIAAELATLREQVEALTAEKTESEGKLKEAAERTEKAEAQLGEVKAKEAARVRLAKLSEVTKIEDEAATLAELGTMTDETFEAVLKYAGRKQDGAAGTDGKSDKGEGTGTGDGEGEADASVLDNVEPDNDPAMNGGGESESETEMTVAKATACRLLGREGEKEE